MREIECTAMNAHVANGARVFSLAGAAEPLAHVGQVVFEENRTMDTSPGACLAPRQSTDGVFCPESLIDLSDASPETVMIEAELAIRLYGYSGAYLDPQLTGSLDTEMINRIDRLCEQLGARLIIARHGWSRRNPHTNRFMLGDGNLFAHLSHPVDVNSGRDVPDALRCFRDNLTPGVDDQ
jgi:hypothetical protein